MDNRKTAKIVKKISLVWFVWDTVWCVRETSKRTDTVKKQARVSESERKKKKNTGIISTSCEVNFVIFFLSFPKKNCEMNWSQQKRSKAKRRRKENTILSQGLKKEVCVRRKNEIQLKRSVCVFFLSFWPSEKSGNEANLELAPKKVR